VSAEELKTSREGRDTSPSPLASKGLPLDFQVRLECGLIKGSVGMPEGGVEGMTVK
jgi:hypothetical protein